MCVIIVLTVAIAASGCKFMSLDAEAALRFAYTIKVRYVPGATRADDRVTMTLVVEGGSIKEPKYVNLRMYAFDTYIRESHQNFGVWQAETDVRKSGLVKEAEVVYGDEENMEFTVDVTDLYRYTNAFNKQDPSDIESGKSFYYDDEKGYVLRFRGNSYYESVLGFAVTGGVADDTESLYEYLETYKYAGGNRYRSTFSEFDMFIIPDKGRYRINNGEWIQVDGRSTDFVLDDYNKGDVIWYQAIYPNDKLSAPVSHTISDLTVYVDTDGGNINGKTDNFSATNKGSKEQRICIATDREEVSGFTSETCKRGEETLEGFEIVEGEGEIKKEPCNAYRMTVEMTIKSNGRKRKAKDTVDAGIVEQFDNMDDFKAYYCDYLTKQFSGTVVVNADTMEVYVQHGSRYYVYSDADTLSVRAIWSGSRKNTNKPLKYTLVKAGSNMYGKFMARRTDCDTGWLITSFRASETVDSDELKAMSEYHTTILPNGKIL